MEQPRSFVEISVQGQRGDTNQRKNESTKFRVYTDLPGEEGAKELLKIESVINHKDYTKSTATVKDNKPMTFQAVGGPNDGTKEE